MNEITWTDGSNIIVFTEARWVPLTLTINGIERPVKGRKGEVIGHIAGRYNGKGEPSAWYVHKGDTITITTKD